MEYIEGDGFRQVVGVLVVFGLLACVVWKLKQGPVGAGPLMTLGGKRGAQRLEAAGRLGLTPQHVIHLVRVDGNEFLVATHPQGCALLTEATPRPGPRQSGGSPQ